jgi:TRAP-type C4-dicarboxylate transport system permease small subunit
VRSYLDSLYRLSGALAAFFIAAICLTVVLQVAANIVDKLAAWLIGAPIGLLIPSYAEFTGFFLAAATFFALAHALRAGSHIRVSLIIRNFRGRARRWIELWCLALALALSAFFTFYALDLVYESWFFGDLAVGMVALPMWIPQAAMALGLVVLTVALLDDLVCVARGGEPSYQGIDETTGAPTAGD